MALKHLAQFHVFNHKDFFAGKDLMYVGKKPWVDYNTKKPLGFKFECVIRKDETAYQKKADDMTTNLYEKIEVKVPHDIDIPMQASVELVNPVCTVWGDHKNQLSIKCDDIKVLNNQASASPVSATTGMARPLLKKEG